MAPIIVPWPGIVGEGVVHQTAVVLPSMILTSHLCLGLELPSCFQVAISSVLLWSFGYYKLFISSCWLNMVLPSSSSMLENGVAIYFWTNVPRSWLPLWRSLGICARREWFWWPPGGKSLTERIRDSWTNQFRPSKYFVFFGDPLNYIYIYPRSYFPLLVVLVFCRYKAACTTSGLHKAGSNIPKIGYTKQNQPDCRRLQLACCFSTCFGVSSKRPQAWSWRVAGSFVAAFSLA